MTPEERRELRYKSSANHIDKAREQFPKDKVNWLLSLPSHQLGYRHIVSIPLVTGCDFKASLGEWKMYFSNELLREEEGSNLTDRKLMSALQAIMTNKLVDQPYDIQHELVWFIIHYFQNIDKNKSIEIYDDKQVVVVDFNFVEVPLPSETIH